jgi:hypothetical protein
LTKYILKLDKYRKSRGGYSRLLEVSCEKCGEIVCHYQKDGQGPLKRLYADRVVDLKSAWKNNQKLVCRKCKRWLGIASKYQEEKRPCFILFQDSVIKNIKKL